MSGDQVISARGIKNVKQKQKGVHLFIYETCAWTPNNVFSSMIVVESLSRQFDGAGGGAYLEYKLFAAELGKSRQV